MKAGRIVAAVTFAAALCPAALCARQATLSGPASVPVGAPLPVAWTGPAAARDFISVDAPDMNDAQYGAYVYTQQGSPAALTAPDAPGRYLVRYHSGDSGYRVLATHAVEVTERQVALTFPASVEAGGALSVEWSGPSYPREFISIDAVGASDREYGTYAYASASPASLRAPDQPGSYVVRYHLASSYRVVGSAPLVVGGVSATLTAPARVQAGSDIEVTWTGPNGALDYVSIDSLGSAEREYGPYAYTRAGSPLTIRVPEAPGRYELRYHMGASYAVVTAVPLEVLANTATVRGPASAAAGSSVSVEWTGPNNQGDYVTFTRVGASNRDYLSYQYTGVGTPLSIEAPLEVGAYEIRYVTGGRREVLASTPITVTPGVVPGSLRVVGMSSSATGAIEVILDASGSMLQRLDGERRIEIARDALTRLVTEVIPAGTPFALRVFGHREADSCRTDLEIPLGRLDPTAAAGTIRGVQAMNLARTPIGASLRLVRQDLATVQGPILVVLVSDGEETCDDDPLAAIAELRAAGIDVRVNVVGFALDEHRLREMFESWARAGGGVYVEARDRAELQRAMDVTVQTSFEVLAGDDVVATGVVNGEPVSLRPGAYLVRVLAGGTAEEHTVEVTAGGSHTVTRG